MSQSLTRRTFLALSAMLPFSLRAFGAGSSIPVGLELYSVRNALKDDLMGTVRTVGQMGYQCVEFYAPYYDWTDQQAKDMKKLLDDLGVRCYSTHNSQSYFTTENLKHARDLNLILGAKYVVMSSSQPKPGLDGWKEVADQLNAAADQLQPDGLRPDITIINSSSLPLMANAPSKSWPRIRSHRSCCNSTSALAWRRGLIRSPGFMPIPAGSGRCIARIGRRAKDTRFCSVKESADWKNIFAAAESGGGIEYYLIEQEGSRFPEFETAKKCLENFRKIHP